MRGHFIALGLLAGLSACAGANQPTFDRPEAGPVPPSYVADSIQPNDAAGLATAMTSLVTMRISAGAGPINLITPPTADSLTPALTDSLRAAGYKIEPTGQTRISYQVGPLDRDVLVRMSLGTARAARVFRRDRDGSLQPSGPFTLMEVAAR